MVLTRAQMENMTKEELIEELSKTTDISDKLDKFTVVFEDFAQIQLDEFGISCG